MPSSNNTAESNCLGPDLSSFSQTGVYHIHHHLHHQLPLKIPLYHSWIGSVPAESSAIASSAFGDPFAFAARPHVFHP
jgi:hypothetical protein